MKLILASASPRRRELLQQIGLEYEVLVSETQENTDPSWEPYRVVEELSARKAEAVRAQAKDRWIIGADTVVACDGRVLGKPKNRENALEMLSLLQNRTHEVYTGVTILTPEGERRTFHECTKVTFAPMSREEIEEYVATGDPMDKAGSYGIQGFCARYIKKIEGDYQNVVGLPVSRLYRELSFLRRRDARKKLVIFDLDGTLSDSLGSLIYSGNTMLGELGLPGFGSQEYRYFVGDGAQNLVRRALAAAGDTEGTLFEQAYRRYKEIFAVHCMDGVKPYDGIAELLDWLKKQGIRLAVLSNKPHAETIRVIETLFGKGVFDIIQGQTENLPLKPDPAGVFKILREFAEIEHEEIQMENVCYVGDTGTDMRTGKSAGAFTCGALWGFREREELEEYGADVLLAKPMELQNWIRI